MGAAMITSPPERWPERSAERVERTERQRGEVVVLTTPVWSLRVEGRRLSIVMQRATLPAGAELSELSIELPHVSFPFDFREGLDRFRHHRGVAEDLTLRIEARVVLDWLNQVSGGQIAGSAQDDQLVLSGKADNGTRWTMRARFVAAPASDASDANDDGAEPLLQLSLFGMRAYGPTSEPWPRLAERVIDLLPKELVVDRGLTTARIRCVRTAVAWVLAGLGWKLPDFTTLTSHGVELREGRFIARFSKKKPGHDKPLVAELSEGAGGSWEAGHMRGAFERFVEDLELKRHHGQVDRLLAEGRVREALAEVYRALDGPPRPGFLAERLIGITASQPILYDEGERHCRALLELAPGYEPALVGLAAIALGRGRPEEAAVQLERLSAMVTAPSDREDATAADLTLAAILKDFAPEESRAALSRVLERSPDHEEALSELIALAEAEGDVRSALPLYKRLLFAARSKARTRDAGLRLARFALLRNEPEDARVLLKVVLEAAPDDLEAQVALAEVETREGNGLAALRILEDALRAIPPSDSTRLVQVIQKLAHLLLDTLADPARARRVLWRAGDVARVDAKEAIGLAKLALSAREAVLALRFVEMIANESSEWAEGQALRAEALIERGDAATALVAVLAVLSREPDHEGALALLERSAPDPARREWLVHQLYETARRVPAGEPRARILNRVARLYESLGLDWDMLAPLEESVFEALDSPRFLERAERLMNVQARFGLWPDHQRVGALRLTRLQAAGLADEGAIAGRVDLLMQLGRVALEELGDATGARLYLEDAGRLSPRSLDAQELLARALEAELAQSPGGYGGPVRELAGALTRLEALRPASGDKDRARMRLAELQLDRLGSPGQARATLGRLSHLNDLERIALARRAGLVANEPVQEYVAPVVQQAVAPVAQAGPDRFEMALAAADRGDEFDAVALLEALLSDEPDHVPAQELMSVLIEAAFGAADVPLMSFEQPRYESAEEADYELLAEAPTNHRDEPLGEPLRVGSLTSSALPSRVHEAASESVAEVDPDAEDSAPILKSARFTAPPAAIADKVAEGDAIDLAMGQAAERYFAGDLDGAREALEALLAVDPDVIVALELYQEVLAGLGDNARRAEVLETLVMRVFDAQASAAYLRMLGEARAAAGDEDGSRSAYVRYLRVRPLDIALFSRVMVDLEGAGADSAVDRAELWEARADALDDADASDDEVAQALSSAAKAHSEAGDEAAAAHAGERARAFASA